MKLLLINLIALSFLLFSCQGSTSNSENFDDFEERTYECPSCGAIITQTMLENGMAIGVINSNTPNGLDIVCAKHSNAEDEVAVEEKCMSCGSTDIGVTDEGYVFCNICRSSEISVE